MHEPPNPRRLVRGIAAGDPLVGAWITRSVAEWSVRTARIDRQPCVRSPHAPQTRNPEPRVRENRKTESRKTDSGTRGALNPCARKLSDFTIGFPKEM